MISCIFSHTRLQQRQRRYPVPDKVAEYCPKQSPRRLHMNAKLTSFNHSRLQCCTIIYDAGSTSNQTKTILKAGPKLKPTFNILAQHCDDCGPTPHTFCLAYLIIYVRNSNTTIVSLSSIEIIKIYIINPV